jgi:N-ethylmaleimide reductase
MSGKQTIGPIPKDILFSPFDLGSIPLLHRVVHAPTTRLRASPDESPSPMMETYYQQRASRGGLIITETTHPSRDSRGYDGAPSIYAKSHVHAWQRIVSAVHAKGGKIVMQVGHDGRQSHVDLSGGAAPIAPSVVPFVGEAFTRDGWVPVSPHRAIEIDEIPQLVSQFRDAAAKAMDAGFDGIELHNANGYLADTFLQDGTNRRTDRYGGSLKNRARFSLELIDALVSVWGPGRVGVRVSPSGQWGAISDSDPEATFGHLAERLNERPLAYLHIIEPRVKGVETIAEGQGPVASAFLRKIFKGAIIAAGGFNKPGAVEILESGDADLVAFGRLFTSNPDLPERLRMDLPLTPYHREAFWGGDERWYSDFEAYSHV